MSVPAQTRILIVDDNVVVRRALTELLGQEPDLIVCGAVENALAALRAMQEEPIDLAIVDISLGQTDGIELTQMLKQQYPGLRILVFSMHDGPHFAERALRAGASAFVAKQTACETLVPTIRHVIASPPRGSNTDSLCA